MRHVALLAALGLSACAAPVDGLWPPAPGAPTVPIRVLSNGWHSLLFVPDAPGPPYALHEWSFGEWAWYRAPEPSSGMALPAMLWPTRATVHVVDIPDFAFVDAAADEFEIWRFELSLAGHERLLEWVRESRRGELRAAGSPSSEWYAADDSYHAFSHCNHWTTSALRAAGLPVWRAYSLFHTGFALQLDRAEGWGDGPTADAVSSFSRR